MTAIGQRVYDDYAFTNDLPINPKIDTRYTRTLTLQIQEGEQFLGMYDEAGHKLKTTVWGYSVPGMTPGFHGPTIVAYENRPLKITWENKLDVDAHLLPVDETIHMAHPTEGSIANGVIPIVSHLHGGHTDADYDGGPEAWYTPDVTTSTKTTLLSGSALGSLPIVGGLISSIENWFSFSKTWYKQSGSYTAPDATPGSTGSDYVGNTFTYDNDQQSAPLWYHDHALGITRLNVYAGLAGMYLLQDWDRINLAKENILPNVKDVVDIVIQDYSFDDAGNLYYPGHAGDMLPDGSGTMVMDEIDDEFYEQNGMDAVSALPEYFGDVILANGMAWPKLDVAQGEVQVTLLNGSDSRFYKLQLDNPNIRATLVGTEGGLLPNARKIFDGDGVQEKNEFLILAPSERVEVVFDFSKLSDGEKVTLLNTGPAWEPYKGINYATGELNVAEAATIDDSVGSILQFVADSSLEAENLLVKHNTKLDSDYASIKKRDIDHTRKLGLFEGTDEFGRIKPQLGTAEAGKVHTDEMTPDGKFGPLSWMADTTEKVQLGDSEYWDIFNFTEDAHPVHIHLVQFQNVRKYAIDFEDNDENGVPDDLTGDGKITYGYERKGAVLGETCDIMVFNKKSLPFRAEEKGWQDTTIVGPKEMLRVAATYDKPGEFVWHCHILSHEDNDMMRPFLVEEV
ncbi:multicopper oxidase family protein [Donghicola mangrovi]|uniref:Multicopper oxidase domain-containing protein n=1 Tax=Donghicola mangrovi TaxID=2729614 RepID=A0A850Q7Y0_9RHOB|nr:multicopper oxidase domain-containing protein [Donghicola mangrovi]NVO24322.1 multicopper oxidase domain-containing protein [Donghicola mangrovi]